MFQILIVLAAVGWAFTGSMSNARVSNAAVLLKNGSVLVAGGCNGNPCMPVTSAEVYDYHTGRWQAVGSMAAPRSEYTASLLTNGFVLVAGGCSDPSCSSPLREAELYDPATKRWKSTGSMNDSRRGHTATLLADGTVLVTGGCPDYSCNLVAAAELYGPVAEIWSRTGGFPDSLRSRSASLLWDPR